MMNLVKLRFLRGGEPQGREYTYISKSKVEVGDVVIVREPDRIGAEAPKGVITMVNVPETEVESFKDKLKAIVGKFQPICEDCENFVACGEGDHICIAGDKKAPVMDYEQTEDYLWCRGVKFKEKDY